MKRQPFLKTAGLAAIVLAPMVLAGCATGPVGSDVESEPRAVSRPFSRDSNWVLRLPEAEIVRYRGVVSLDGAGVNTGSMLYPAPNAAGFVAALITHGVLNESMKNSQKTKLQEAADKVLLPFQPALAGFSYKELMQKGLDAMPAGGGRTLVGHSEQSAANWYVESMPIFSMTQDQGAIIIDNFIAVYASGDRSTAAYKNIVRAVSHPRSGANLDKYWSADNGRMLKEVSTSLFAESVGIALDDAADMAKPNANAHKTFRYLEGSTERMERGQLITEHCDRVVIKTLRGAPMSIPVRRDVAAAPVADCGRVAGKVN